MKKRIPHLLSASVVIFFLFLAIGSSKERSIVHLNVSIIYTGTQFSITNNDNFDYYNTQLEINGKYTLNGYDLKAGQTYDVGIMQFADEDGNRFTLMKKPQKFSIWCELSDNKNGHYYGSMD